MRSSCRGGPTRSSCRLKHWTAPSCLPSPGARRATHLSRQRHVGPPCAGSDGDRLSPPRAGFRDPEAPVPEVHGARFADAELRVARYRACTTSPSSSKPQTAFASSERERPERASGDLERNVPAGMKLEPLDERRSDDHGLGPLHRFNRSKPPRAGTFVRATRRTHSRRNAAVETSLAYCRNLTLLLGCRAPLATPDLSLC
jgi:hypothetical protein